MATFMENLWNSIFTPGTTPTLLVATNVTFAALQLVLGALLATTRSIHFIVLSGLCAGLWWSINWFATELRKAEKAEEEAKRIRRRRSNMSEEKTDQSRDSGDDSTGTETEVEGFPGITIRGGPEKIQAVMDSAAEAEAARQEYAQQQQQQQYGGGIRVRGGPGKAQGVLDSAKAADGSTDQSTGEEGTSSGIFVRGGPEKINAILNSSGAASDPNTKSLHEQESGSVSTDSEWEKVSDR